ncbi:MAG: hypothetical protein M3552_15860, partial [Planctomycetota bacterium]|nr:hypothetical protein [Planctomycetota bacterium]
MSLLSSRVRRPGLPAALTLLTAFAVSRAAFFTPSPIFAQEAAAVAEKADDAKQEDSKKEDAKKDQNSA